MIESTSRSRSTGESGIGELYRLLLKAIQRNDEFSILILGNRLIKLLEEK